MNRSLPWLLRRLPAGLAILGLVAGVVVVYALWPRLCYSTLIGWLPGTENPNVYACEGGWFHLGGGRGNVAIYERWLRWRAATAGLTMASLGSMAALAAWLWRAPRCVDARSRDQHRPHRHGRRARVMSEVLDDGPPFEVLYEMP